MRLNRFWRMGIAACLLLLGAGLPLIGAAKTADKPVSLAVNSGFEDLGANGQVRDWAFNSWQNKSSVSFGGSDNTVAHSGKRSLFLTNLSGDDARFVQNIPVKAETWYRFSVWIKTDSVGKDLIGANISVMEIQQCSRDIRGNSDWTQLEVFGKTGPNQHSIALAMRLGFYSNNAVGKAWFDDLVVEEITVLPSEAPVMSIYQAPAPAAIEATPGLGGYSDLALFLLGMFVCLIYVWATWAFARKPGLLPMGDRLRLKVVTIVILAILLAIKLWVAAVNIGYSGDIGLFANWATDVFKLGPSGFYRPGYFADYPPAYFYVLWVVGAVTHLFHLELYSGAFLAVLKLPAIMADIGAAWLLWRIAKRRQVPGDHPWYLIAPVLWLLSPMANFNSCIWGQVDSVFSLVLLAAFWKLETRKLPLASALYALAILLKPQALLVAPLALLWLIKDRPFSVKIVLQAVGAFVVAAVVLVLPFGINLPPGWIFQLYSGTLGNYNYASLNAANIWYLVGLNWAANTTPFLGLELSVWGWIGSLAGLAWILVCQWRNRKPGAWLFSAFAVYVIFFALATKMHERYLFPAALLGLGAFQVMRDRRVLWAAIAAGLISFLDILVTLRTYLANNSSLVPTGSPLMVLASAAMLGLLIWTLYLCFDLMVRGRGQEPKLYKVPTQAFVIPEMPGPHGRQRALIAVSALTLAYALIALWGLGSISFPNRFWEPETPGSSATFDLGKNYEIATVNYHLGLGTGEYGLDYSSDGKIWERGNPIINDNLFVEMRWRPLQDSHSARYLRVSLTRGRQQLNELTLNAQDGSAIPAPILIQGGGQAETAQDARRLFDEPNTRVVVSDYTNGMYFDEVYFVRSAWEILQGRNATENTHPPLGKLIIAGSISLFGMNPYAWRLPGTLCGVAMIPMMYLLALRLFRRRTWAFLSALLLSVDFMHFTQTRIATVDTYVMLAVLASYYWMLRWYQDARQGPKALNSRFNPLWSLIFSGISIAIAIATKWIGLYAAAGLALMFFAGFAHLGKEWRHKHSLTTILTCCVAFVAIPVMVYVMAYIPLMSVTGSGLTGILDNQTSMWNYHSHIKDSHPFSSQWYEWPLMIKPIWYYSGSANVAPNLVSTIINFGNPVVWMIGSAALLFLIYSLAVRWEMAKPIPGGTPYNQLIGLFIVIAALAQYLPWALIPRKLVFIYHFFLTMPFVLLALVFAARELAERFKHLAWARYVWIVVGAVAVLFFVLYFPVLGGTPVPRWWAEGLKWLRIPIYF